MPRNPFVPLPQPTLLERLNPFRTPRPVHIAGYGEVVPVALLTNYGWELADAMQTEAGLHAYLYPNLKHGGAFLLEGGRVEGPDFVKKWRLV